MQALAAAILVLGPPWPSLGAQGVQYTLMPSATYVRWDEGLGLERAILFGGRAVVDFGPLIALEGGYLTSGGVVARLSESELRDSLGAPLENATVDVTTYGLRVRMNLGNARLAPFLRAGGSVVRFDEGARPGPRQIAVAYGGGIRYNASARVRAELFAEDLRFRLDRSALARAATPGADPERNTLRSNLSFGAGLGFVLGAGTPGTAAEQRWSFASVPLEAFAGQLDFSDPALGAQPLAGVRAGIDAGNYVGLRAFYLRGVSSGYSSFEGVRSLGGEAQFNLNALPRLAPYLVVGGGTLGFQEGYRDSEGEAPPDRTILILGGGVGLRLTDWLRLNIAGRDFLHGRQARIGEVSDVSEVQHNWLYSAGIAFSIGRSRRGVTLVRNDVAAQAAADTAARLAAADSAALHDSLAAIDTASIASRPGAATGTDTALARSDRSYHSAATVVLPIPTEGELYIRYGPPRVRDSMSHESSAPAPAGVGAGGNATAPASGGTVAPAGAVPPSRAAAATEAGEARGGADTAALGAAMRRVLDERRRADSLLISQLVAREVARWATPPASVAGISPAPGRDSLLAALLTDRDAARAEQRRLQLRFDSLEAIVRRESAARGEADAAQRALLDAAQREADRLEAARRDAAQLEADRLEAARRDAAQIEAAERAAAARSAELVEQRRLDALTLVERSIPSVARITDTERGLVIVLGNNLFASGSESLDERARAELRAVASVLALYPEAGVIVEGHTDDVGDEQRNQRLSEARAESVRGALIAHGASSARVTARGYGESRPVADNATADGRARNRRAEVVILGAQRPRVIDR